MLLSKANSSGLPSPTLSTASSVTSDESSSSFSTACASSPVSPPASSPWIKAVPLPDPKIGSKAIPQANNATTRTTTTTKAPLPIPNKLNEGHLKGHSLHPLFSLRYKITHELGQGGHGIVFGGQRRHDGAPVAMKFVLKSSINPSAWVSLSPKEKVPLEVYILSHCQHASIIGLVDYFEQADYLYIVMEMHGTPWQKKTLGMSTIDAAFQALPSRPGALETQIPVTLKRQAPRDLFEYIEQYDHLPNNLARYVFTQVASAVAFMHQKFVIHGDIKDENIVIDQNLRVKLIDFGSAKVIPPHAEGKLDRFGGTINYCAPEILTGTTYSGRAFDVWCSGVLLYTMLTGEVPFASMDDIKKVKRRKPRHPLSKEATDMVDWMLQKDPVSRPTAAQILTHPWIHKAA